MTQEISHHTPAIKSLFTCFQVSDFDELLRTPQFASIEKIKTIGSTYMAASGLNPGMRQRSDNVQHLFDLMEFALALQDVVAAFNRDLLEFNLILRYS